MFKVRTFAAAAVIAAAPVLLPATQAFASTSDWTPPANGCTMQCGAFWDTIPTFEVQEAIFNQGGAELGHGAAELVSAGVVGLAQGILDIPAHVLGFPKPLHYDSCPCG